MARKKPVHLKSDLTQLRIKELFSYDAETGFFTRRVRIGSQHAGTVCKYLDADGHINIRVDGYLYQAHRLAWLYIHGVWPTDGIDHIDGNGSNNRMINLREADQVLNMQNIRKAYKNSKSGLLGVSFYARYSKWTARIKCAGKYKFLGYFSTPESAYEAYLDAKVKLHPFQTLIPRAA